MNMDLGNVALNIYSFGYSAGFIKDDRNPNRVPRVGIKELPDLAKHFGLGGIEFPFDYCFSNRLQEGTAFMQSAQKQGLRVAIDFETFEEALLSRVIPELRACGIDRARIKMNHALYGGNRYMIAEFDKWREEFVSQLQRLVPLLIKARFKLLIENHQDFGSIDLIGIIERTSKEWVGINWDVGNSIAVGETPEMFLARAEQYIGNVHMKDYRIVKTEKGIGLVRCAPGKGVVNFAEILPKVFGVPKSIELGAQNTRYADIDLPQWWAGYSEGIRAGKDVFLHFVDEHMEDGESNGTLWEQKRPPQDIEELELKEISQSIDFLKSLSI